MSCARYIELNPVRAGMVECPSMYPWSSYRFNAQGKTSNIVQSHPLYMELGETNEKRQFSYREMFCDEVDPNLLHSLRTMVQTGTPLGNDRFRAQIEEMLGRKVGQARRGRLDQKKKVKGTDPL